MAARRLSFRDIIVLLFAMCVLSNCSGSPAGTELSQGQYVQNTPNGILLNQQYSRLVTRWRGPMDHGSAVQTDHINYRIWQLQHDGDNPVFQSHPVDFIWKRSLEKTDEYPARQNPTFIKFEGNFVPNGCNEEAIANVTSNGAVCKSALEAPQLVQIGGRSERLELSGSIISFSDGLDGINKPCKLDLQQIAANVDEPIMAVNGAANFRWMGDSNYGDEIGPAFRFAISYLPPNAAYLVDYGDASLPIYRANCDGFHKVGDAVPLAVDLISPGAEQNSLGVKLLDMVVDPDHVRPALFLAVADGNSGHHFYVVRGDKEARRIPYFCHDCWPGVGGFFRSNPDWLIFEGKLASKNGGPYT